MYARSGINTNLVAIEVRQFGLGWSDPRASSVWSRVV